MFVASYVFFVVIVAFIVAVIIAVIVAIIITVILLPRPIIFVLVVIVAVIGRRSRLEPQTSTGGLLPTTADGRPR